MIIKKFQYFFQTYLKSAIKDLTCPTETRMIALLQLHYLFLCIW